MRLKTVLWPTLLLSLIALSGCEIDGIDGIHGIGHYNSDFHYSFPLSAQGRVTVESFNGSVDISTWDQPTVDISGTKYGPTQVEADALKIEVDHSDNSVSVRAVRAFDGRGNRGARFAIKIPRGAVLERVVTSNSRIQAVDVRGPARLKSSNGSIHVERLHGTLDAQTTNSSIELDQVEGDVVAHTSNGHIRAEGVNGGLEADTTNSSVTANIANASRPVRVGTSNGAVELTLPPNFSGGARVRTNNSSIKVYMAAPANAQLSAHTSNSSITTDFDIRVHGDIGKHDLTGQIGNGGPTLDLNTSNGSIRVMKR